MTSGVPASADTIDGDLRAIEDPEERGRRAAEVIEQYQPVVDVATAVRDETIRVLYAAGMRQAPIGRIAGITRARVNQILKADTPGPARPFWGAAESHLTIALGEKREEPKDASGGQGPVVATEDMQAFEMLRELLAGADISADYEMIPAPGIVRLNRAGLLVVCGPRLSPMIAQSAEADPYLGFGKDGAGWHLANRETGESWHSPLDAGEPGDIGYLARLPRPDQNGTFLYIAGIHAAGAPGVAHYLSGNLDALWRMVGTQRFSALISCVFDSRHLVTESSLLSGPYLHGGGSAGLVALKTSGGAE